MFFRTLTRRSPAATRPRIYLICAALLALLSLPQPVRADDFDSQFWSLFTFNARFRSGLRLYAEAQPRLGNNYKEWSQLILRPAVGYQVNRNLSLWLGYGWTPNLNPDYNNEHRLFQQALLEHRISGLDIINRTRLEQRSIEGAGEWAWRFRHQVRLVKPLDAKSQWLAVGMTEVFWNLNSTPNGPESGYDQVRPYLGFGYNVNKHTRIEAGYQLVAINSPRNRPNRRYDVLLIMVNYNL